MQYKGIEYQVVQSIDRRLMWSFQLSARSKAAHGYCSTREQAMVDVKRAIDTKLKRREQNQGDRKKAAFGAVP